MSDAPTYWLPDHVCGCAAGPGAILLDLNRNRYFGVGAREHSAIARLVGNWRRPADQPAELEVLDTAAAVEVAEALVEAGLLARSPPSNALLSSDIDLQQTLASIGSELHSSERLRLRHIVEFLRACAWARRALRTRTLYSIASELSNLKRKGVTFDEARAITLVCHFRKLRPLAFAARDQCLFHALALVRFLAAFNVHPCWVVGVRLRPWAAHSWVQHGRLLLDCTPEAVCEYAPILSI